MCKKTRYSLNISQLEFILQYRSDMNVVAVRVEKEKWWARMGADGLLNLKDPLIMNSKKY